MLRGTPPRLLDEWQNAPQLWNRVRRECDDRALPGQFILTGSALPQDDITRHTGVGRISRVLMRPMSLARHTSTEAKITTLASDAGGDTPLSRNTVAAYLDALERVFVVEDQPAWSVGLRSRAALRRAPKRHFVDPSLAASLLRASPERLLADPETFGLLFESLVVRDLRIYGQEDRCEVFHRGAAGQRLVQSRSDASARASTRDWVPRRPRSAAVRCS